MNNAQKITKIMGITTKLLIDFYTRIVIVHALRNALIPVVTVVGLIVGQLLSGAVLTETIFSWPGIAMIRKEIEKLGIPELEEISIDTVERYQGSQRDIILYSFTIQSRYQLDFLTANTFYEDGQPKACFGDKKGRLNIQTAFVFDGKPFYWLYGRDRCGRYRLAGKRRVGFVQIKSLRINSQEFDCKYLECNLTIPF